MLTIEPPLAGRFQIRNALAAATAAQIVSQRGFAITTHATEQGIRSARWPGRLERLAERPSVYLDGTHNPAGARELLKFWQENFSDRRIFLVYGAMRDKAVDEIAGLLFPAADSVILTEPLQPRAISAPLLAEMTAHLARNSTIVRDPAQALEQAIAVASSEDAVFATGSLYLVGICGLLAPPPPPSNCRRGIPLQIARYKRVTPFRKSDAPISGICGDIPTEKFFSCVLAKLAVGYRTCNT